MLLKIPNVLSAAEVQDLLGMLQALPYEDGAATGHPKLKKNLQMLGKSPAAQQGVQVIARALFRNKLFTSFAFPRNVQIVFNRYEPGMFYKDHNDAALMGNMNNQPIRTDLSFTVFLSDPASYEGGDFVMRTGFGELRVREPAGSAICYPSNMLHRVEPIVSGARWAAVGWIQSFVRNLDQRLVLFEMDQLRSRVTANDPDHAEEPVFGQIRETLLRQWVEV